MCPGGSPPPLIALLPLSFRPVPLSFRPASSPLSFPPPSPFPLLPLFGFPSLFQALVRGFLVRRRLQSVRGEYEAAVRDIEGEESTLLWGRRPICRPQFIQAVGAKEKLPYGAVQCVCPGSGQAGYAGDPTGYGAELVDLDSHAAASERLSPERPHTSALETAETGGGAARTDAKKGGGTAQTDAKKGGGAARTDAERVGGAAQTDAERGGGAAQTDAGGGAARTAAERVGGAVQTDAERGGGAVQTDAERGGVAVQTDAARGGGAARTDAERGGGAALTDAGGGAARTAAERVEDAVQTAAERGGGAVQTDAERGRSTFRTDAERGGGSTWTDPERGGGAVRTDNAETTDRGRESLGWSRDSSIWSSTVLEADTGLPFRLEPEDLPGKMSELQQHRNHLAMEMLWVQQAIASRKNYLLVRQKLGTPDR
ncbi:hypothetical protein FKM82_013771 [Ascaphus truei]